MHLQNNLSFIMEHLKEIFFTKFYSDVTLVSDDQKQYKAHKVILGNCSPILKEILENCSDENPVIYLNEIKSEEIQIILEIIYLGQNYCKIKSTTKDTIVSICKNLGIKGIDNFSKSNPTVIDDCKSSSDTNSDSQTPNNEVQKSQQEQSLKGEPDVTDNYILCYECHESFQTLIERRKHYASQHPGKNIYICQNCDYKTNYLTHLNNHHDSKHAKKEFQCSHCSFVTTWNTSFSTHMRLNHKIFKRKSKNSKNGKLIQNKKKLKSEESIRKKELEKLQFFYLSNNCTPKDCPDCEKTFSNTTNMRTHYNSVHRGIVFPCDHCDYKATQKGHLKAHIQSLHGKTTVCFCNLCDKKFSSKPSLRYHIYNYHTVKKDNGNFSTVMESGKIKCRDCDKEYLNRNNLLRHFNIVHKGFRVSCDMCDFKAGEKSALKTHIQSIHEKIRYDCSQCDYKATQKGHLKTHMKRQHDDNSINAGCFKRKMQQSISIEHPQECPECQEKFLSHATMLKHYDSVHEGVPHYIPY